MYDKCDGEPSFPGIFFVPGKSTRQQQQEHCCSEELSHVRSCRRRVWKYPVYTPGLQNIRSQTQDDVNEPLLQLKERTCRVPVVLDLEV